MAANYFVGRRTGKDPKEGSTISSLLEAIALLAAFLLAIVIGGASASFSAAQGASKQEADVSDTFYESAEYVDMPFRQRIQAAAVCYARAVIGPEWKTLAFGALSPVPSSWTGTRPGGLRATLIEMTPHATGFDLVQSTDVERGHLRTERLTEADSQVPDAVTWFMEILVAVSLGGLAYDIPRSGNRGHLVALTVVVLGFVGAIALIYNLDRPFGGVLAIKPSAMRATEADVSADYADTFHVALPCDHEGNPATP